MQTNTTDLSMETIFDIVFLGILCFLISQNIAMSKKISELQKNQLILDESLAGDIDGIEKGLVKLSEKVESIPNIIKDDNHRSLLALRDTLETTKPIRPNNWDSMKEAFKGPTRIEINERN